MVALLILASGCTSSAAGHAERRERLLDDLSRNAVHVIGPQDLHVVRGQRFAVALQLKIATGFYVVAPAAKDEDLLPLWIDVPKRGTTYVSGVRWPTPALVDLPSRTAPVLAFSGVVSVNVQMTVAAGAPVGEHLLRLPVHYQQCTARGCEVPRRRDLRVPVFIHADLATTAQP